MEQKSRAFTLTELVVVIVIISILASIAVVGFSSLVGKTRQRAVEASAASFDREHRALLAFYAGGTITEADVVAAADEALVRVRGLDNAQRDGTNVEFRNNGKCAVLELSSDPATSGRIDACDGEAAVTTAPGAGGGTTSTSPPTTPTTVASPDQVTGVSASAGNAEVAVSWSALSSTPTKPVAGYRVYYSTGAGAPLLGCQISGAGSTTCTVTGLTNGTGYSFQVVAYYSSVEGVASNPATATPATVPGAPTALTATAGDTEVYLAWSAPTATGGSEVTDYVIEYSTGGASWTTVADGISTATELTVGALTNDTAYTVRVAAVNDAGVGAAATSSPTTPRGVPGAVANLDVKSYEASAVTITWDAPTSGGSVQTYKVEQSTDNELWETLSSSVTSRTYTASGISAATTYWFRVTALNAVASGTATAVSFAYPGVSATVWATKANAATAAVANSVSGSAHGNTLSASGRWAVYNTAEAMVPADTNGIIDTYIADLFTGRTTLVSATPAGAAGNGVSQHGSFSDDERWVIFSSQASNLTADTDDGAGGYDVFVFDRDTDGDGVFDEAGATQTRKLSITPAGGVANGVTEGGVLSSTGRYVALRSEASNLNAAEDDTNGLADVYWLDRDTDGDGVFDEAGDYTYLLLSRTSTGAIATKVSGVPKISGNGMRVAFGSNASLVSADLNEASPTGSADAYVVNIAAGARTSLTLVSLKTQGAGTGTASGDVGSVRMTGDGNWITFTSFSSEIVAGDTGQTDIFLYNVSTGTNIRLSVNTSGTTANAGSGVGQPIANGSSVKVLFQSSASNLVSGDTNGVQDVFLWSSNDSGATGTITRVVAGASSRASHMGGISNDGSIIVSRTLHAFDSADTNNANDMYFVRLS
jgi:prepilin-type N-terminal cleavage/methylation domain-containing protein